MSGPRPPTPSPKGRGSIMPMTPPPLAGGGWGEGASPRDRANSEQLSASDPAVSAFVGASAGSGKTKLLTDWLLPQPGFAPRFSNYAQLARVAEWAAAG